MLLLNQTSAIQKFLITDGRTRWLTALIFLAAILLTATISRDNWPLILLPFGIAMLIYGLLFTPSLKYDQHIRFWLVVALVARGILIFTFPNLSDDLYRFIWDGHCTLMGLNPYNILPSEFIATNGETGYLTTELFGALNSPNYYTVYPPMSQYLFAIASWIGGDDWLISSMVFKLILFAAECSTIWMMYHIFTTRHRGHLTLLYALNPLVIVEIVGNIHFEGLMIWGIIAAYYVLLQLPKKATLNLVKAAGAIVVSLYVKLIPVIIVPLLWRRLGMRKFIILCGLILALLILLALPFVLSFSGDGPADSLDLYFHTFEFNAGLYYVFRWFGYLWKGYNMIATIGTLTSLLTIVLLAALFLLERQPQIKDWPRAALLGLTIYFLFASIVHPWYICGLVALAPFTRFRYPIVWSALAFLSYSAYRLEPVQENLVLIAVEYTIVIGFFIWEIAINRTKDHAPN